MEDLIPWLAFGLPILVVVGLIWYFLGKPDREVKKLEARAAAGDPEAQAAIARMHELRGALNRAAGMDDGSKRRVLETGRAARATIVDVKPLGLTVEAGPLPTRLVEVVLSLDEGAGPRTVTVRDGVSEMHLGRLLKGATVPVKIDVANPANIVVQWDTL